MPQGQQEEVVVAAVPVEVLVCQAKELAPPLETLRVVLSEEAEAGDV